MNQSSQTMQPARRFRLLPLLLCSVAWAVMSFGCVTLNYVTEVIYMSENLGAVVSLETEINKGVYDALKAKDPTLTSGIGAAQSEAGWTVKQSEGGRKLLMRRTFSSLEELKTVPQLLAGDAEDTSGSFVQQIEIVATEINEEMIHYAFTATVVIEETSDENEASSSGEEGDFGFSLSDVLAEYPGLEAAMYAAGPAKIIVQTYLPGKILLHSINSVDGGEVRGGRVRWEFSEDQPGIYVLNADSVGPGIAAIERILKGFYDSSENIKRFNDLPLLAFGIYPVSPLSIFQHLSDLRLAQGRDPNEKTLTATDKVVLEAAYYTQFCELENVATTCVLPSVNQAMPLIKRLAAQAGNDAARIEVLSGILAQLVENDVNKIPERMKAR